MKKWMVVFVILVIFVLPGFSQSMEGGEDKEALVTMEEVVVTGTRSVQEVKKIPAHVAIITTDQIKASGAQSVPDVLRSLGGVMVRDLNGNANRHGRIWRNGRPPCGCPNQWPQGQPDRPVRRQMDSHTCRKC